MRICVFGAGAIGGNFAARLAAAGNEVSIVVRGAHLEAIRARGLTLLTGDRKIVVPVQASDRPADLGPQDVVLSTMKASGQHALAQTVAPLLRSDTMVAFVQKAARDPVFRLCSYEHLGEGSTTAAPRPLGIGFLFPWEH